MSRIAKQNGRLEVVSQPERLGNLLKAVYNDEAVTLGQLSQYVNTAVSFKKYVALLTQAGTAAPVATVLENTLGGTVVWSYTGVGRYTATLSGAFTSDLKTWISVHNSVFNTQTGLYWVSTSALELDTSTLAGVATNNQLTSTSVEVRVYI